MYVDTLTRICPIIVTDIEQLMVLVNHAHERVQIETDTIWIQEEAKSSKRYLMCTAFFNTEDVTIESDGRIAIRVYISDLNIKSFILKPYDKNKNAYVFDEIIKHTQEEIDSQTFPGASDES